MEGAAGGPVASADTPSWAGLATGGAVGLGAAGGEVTTRTIAP